MALYALCCWYSDPANTVVICTSTTLDGLRRRIWACMFPAQAPTSDLDLDKLARLNLPGGNIRNVALNAAFLAADEGSAVRMDHLLTSAQHECGKLDKQLSKAEIGGWA